MRAWLAALYFGLPLASAAQVYVGHSDSGSIVLSNHAQEGARELLLADEGLRGSAPGADSLSVAPSPGTTRRIDPSPDLAASIRRVAQRHGLPEALLTALIAVESNFDHRAVSRKGARGLMQLMPDTARRFGVRDAFSVDDNLEGGAAYLRWLLGQFGDDVHLALAAYNAGEGAVERAGRRVPDYRETRDYVRKVMALAAQRAPARSVTAAR